jgi:hypothetical protein
MTDDLEILGPLGEGLYGGMSTSFMYTHMHTCVYIVLYKHITKEHKYLKHAYILLLTTLQCL